MVASREGKFVVIVIRGEALGKRTFVLFCFISVLGRELVQGLVLARQPFCP